MKMKGLDRRDDDGVVIEGGGKVYEVYEIKSMREKWVQEVETRGVVLDIM
jgi:hypothetical protein